MVFKVIFSLFAVSQNFFRTTFFDGLSLLYLKTTDEGLSKLLVAVFLSLLSIVCNLERRIQHIRPSYLHGLNFFFFGGRWNFTYRHWKLKTYTFENHLLLHLPAREFAFAETQLKAVLSRAGGLVLFAEPFESVSLHPVEAPGPFTGFYAKARFLRVYREHGKLWFAQRSYKWKKRHKKYK